MGRASKNRFKLSNFDKMLAKVSSFFPVVSKELHVSLSNARDSRLAIIRSEERQTQAAIGGLNIEGLAVLSPKFREK